MKVTVLFEMDIPDGQDTGDLFNPLAYRGIGQRILHMAEDIWADFDLDFTIEGIRAVKTEALLETVKAEQFMTHNQ